MNGTKSIVHRDVTTMPARPAACLSVRLGILGQMLPASSVRLAGIIPPGPFTPFVQPPPPIPGFLLASHSGANLSGTAQGRPVSHGFIRATSR